MTNFAGNVTMEICVQLMNACGERFDLDYKSELDLSKTEPCLDLAKDIAAMCVNGGHILVGVENNGTPSNQISLLNESLWDESRVRSKLSRWLPNGVELNIAIHTIEEHRIVIIYVHQHSDGLVILKSEGQFQDASGNPQLKFCKGDIFTRHGTSSELVHQEDIHAIIERTVNRHRESWRTEEHIKLLSDKGIVGSGSSIGRPLMAELSWQLPLDVFKAAILRSIQIHDFTSIRELLLSTSSEVSSAITTPNPDLPFTDILARITTVASSAAIHNEDQLFSEALDAFRVAYFSGLDRNGNKRVDTLIPAALIWLEVLKHIYALGGLLVRLKRWNFLEQLAIQRLEGSAMDYSDNWLLHGLTEAADANHLDIRYETGSKQRVLLLRLAQDTALAIPALNVLTTKDEDAHLDSICQFDTLACLLAMNAAKSSSARFFYPNSAHFYSDRSQPILDELVSSNLMRKALGLIDDVELANYLTSYFASDKSFSHKNEISTRFESGRASEWLKKHSKAT